MKISKCVKYSRLFFACIIGSCGLFQSTGPQSYAGRCLDLRGTWKLVSNEIITNGQTEKVFPVEG